VHCYTSHISEPFRLVVDVDGEPALEVRAGRLTYDELAALSRCLEQIPMPRVSSESDLAVVREGPGDGLDSEAAVG